MGPGLEVKVVLLVTGEVGIGIGEGGNDGLVSVEVWELSVEWRVRMRLVGIGGVVGERRS